MAFNNQQQAMTDDLNSRFNVTSVEQDTHDYANFHKSVAKETLQKGGIKTRGPGSGLKGEGFGVTN